MLKNLKSKVLGLVSLAVVTVSSVMSFADATTPASMLPSGVTDIIADFAADVPLTALAVVAVVVPVGLGLWAISFGVKKGIGFLQKKANKSL